MNSSAANPMPADHRRHLFRRVHALLAAVAMVLATLTAVPSPVHAAAGGTVVAWGDDSSGQSTVPDGLTGVVQVAAGGNFSLALKSDGTLTAWGLDYEGVTSVPGVINATQVAAGYFHALALLSDGTVTAWGWNGNGQASVPDGLTGVVQVAAGDRHSLALLSDGTVMAWGDDSQGQSTVPDGLTDVVQVAAGGGVSLALRSDGTVTGWGYDHAGVTLAPPAGLRGVIGIAAGGDVRLALKSDGTVTQWSENHPRGFAPSGFTNVLQISTGGTHSLALRSGGTIATWGDDTYGQTVVPAGLTGATRISAGGAHNLAIVHPLVGFPQTARTVTENAGTVYLPVTRTRTTSTATVNYSLGGGRATAGSDFIFASGTLTFISGQSTKAIALTIRNDTVAEAAETIVVGLSSPSPGTELRSPATMTVTIAASDQRPDALISTSASSGYAGDNVYATGATTAQTKTTTVRRTGRTLTPRSFYVRVQNDGTSTAVIAVKGSRASSGSTVRYFSGSTDVTAGMHSGSGWRVALARGAYRLIRVQLQISSTVRAGSVRYASVWGTWSGDGTRSDLVRSAVNVVR
ncbi:Calx-beta domain-containing protein [Planomonospora sp. ID82291]|uniref:Calx-beta domain-containing protein n=1 Tax=Planomonospora sp. ID82291 TaxID=2738136 RepID=UPI0018C383A4|nr:Calx-beta domain-containing protein [Planomonospora sp. ID82291]MBG0816752.1 hypothetical protein [Planomonospora sp. ID82291]